MRYHKPQLKDYLCLFFSGTCWGSSYIFIKIALAEIGPFALATSRLWISAIAMYIALRIMGHSLKPYLSKWKDFLVLGMLGVGIPFTFISASALYIPTSVTAILVATSPIFTALIAHQIVPGERSSKSKAIGVIMGFLGIVCISLPNIGKDDKFHYLGIIFVLIAAILYALSSIYAKRKFMATPAFVMVCLQMFFAGIIWLPISIFLEPESYQQIPSLRVTGSLLYLGFIGGGISYGAWHILIKRTGPTFASNTMNISPVVGLILGVSIVGEQLAISAMLGAILIITGLFIFGGGSATRR